MKEPDWLDRLTALDAEKQRRTEELQRKDRLRFENLSALWRALRTELKTEAERYQQRFPSNRLRLVDQEFSRLVINTEAYPAVSLVVSCCGETNKPSVEYEYTTVKSYDVPPETENGRLVVDVKGDEVYLRLPDGTDFPHPKNAAIFLLERVVKTFHD